MAVSRYRSVIEYAQAYAEALEGSGVAVRFEVRGRRGQAGAQVVAIYTDGDRTGEDRATLATLRASENRRDVGRNAAEDRLRALGRPVPIRPPPREREPRVRP